MTLDSAPQPLRIGVLGAGRIARRFHLPVLAAMDHVHIAAVAEENAEARENCKVLAPRAALFSRYQDLVDAGLVEAVVICLPPALHATAAIQSFGHGLHVYLEKPLATALEEGERVIRAWREAKTTARIGFNFRFNPLVIEMRDAIRRGAIGDLVAARTSFCAAAREGLGWKAERALGGGVLLDLGSHQFDLLRFVLGQQLTEVSGMLDSRQSEEDCAAIELRLEGGQLVNVFSSISGAEQHRVEIMGTEGEIVLDRYRCSRLQIKPSKRRYSRPARFSQALRTIADCPQRIRDVLLPPREKSFERALQSFVKAVRGEPCAGPGLQCGLDSLAVVAAAEQAARSGQRVLITSAIEDAN